MHVLNLSRHSTFSLTIRFKRALGVSARLAAGILLLALLLQCRAWGFAHLWTVNEIYSNVDASVQFIEMTNASVANDESFLSGLTITCFSALATNSFTFPSNLPSGTAFKTFLIGTTNLNASPGGLKPDYVVSAPFVLPGSGTINFGGFDQVSYNNLPDDGVASMVRSGAAMIFSSKNAPKNFAGTTNSLVPVKFSSIAAGDGNVTLNFSTGTRTNGFANPLYAIEGNDSIVTTNWTTLTNVAGDGANKALTLPTTAPPERFFRLRVE